jgi:hypothetical protein
MQQEGDTVFDNKKYVVFSYSDINNVNFDEVLETSANTVRRSVDGSLTFIKYEGVMPPSVDVLITKSQEYTHEEITTILSGLDWTVSMDEV